MQTTQQIPKTSVDLAGACIGFYADVRPLQIGPLAAIDRVYLEAQQLISGAKGDSWYFGGASPMLSANVFVMENSDRQIEMWRKLTDGRLVEVSARPPHPADLASTIYVSDPGAATKIVERVHEILSTARLKVEQADSPDSENSVDLGDLKLTPRP